MGRQNRRRRSRRARPIIRNGKQKCLPLQRSFHFPQMETILMNRIIDARLGTATGLGGRRGGSEFWVGVMGQKVSEGERLENGNLSGSKIKSPEITGLFIF